MALPAGACGIKGLALFPLGVIYGIFSMPSTGLDLRGGAAYNSPEGIESTDYRTPDANFGKQIIPFNPASAP